MLDLAGKPSISAGCARHLPSAVDENTESRDRACQHRLANSWMAKTSRRAKMKRSATPIRPIPCFFSRIKIFLCTWEFFPSEDGCVTLSSGPGRGLRRRRTAEAVRMKNADEARESGISRGIDRKRAARYVLDIIPESAGPRRATAQGSVIYSVCGPGSQTFLAKEYSAGIVLAPMQPAHRSPSGRIAHMNGPHDGAGPRRVITNCFSRERPGRPRVELYLELIRRPKNAGR